MSVKRNIRNIVCGAVIALGLSVTAAVADSLGPSTYGGASSSASTNGGNKEINAGCNPSITQAQKSNSDVRRSVEKGYDTEMIKQPDSVLGLTCFDEGLKNTAQMGRIFSDAQAAVSGGGTGAIWGLLQSGVFSMMPGLSNTLSSSIGSMVVPALGSFLSGNFAGTISSLFGGALDIFPSWSGGMASTPSSMNCTRIQEVWEAGIKGTSGPSGSGGSGGTSGAGGSGSSSDNRNPAIGSPYLPIGDLLTGALQGMGTSFIQQLVGNNSVLTTAMQTLSMMSSPSASYTRDVPSVPAQSSFAALVGMMN